MSLEEKLIESKELFSGKIIRVLLDKVTLPNGHEAPREVVRHNGAACVLAITPDNKVILVKQYRHPTGEIMLEVPAGKLDKPKEAAAGAALRELAEETPYTAQSVTLLHEFYSAPGFCDEKLFLYQANGVQQNSQLSADEDEFVETVLLTKKQVKQALKKRKIVDAKTIIALQTWLLQGKSKRMQRKPV
ncbi:NUDIX hydrolase [Neisseria sp. Ec49-e6-T10]|uniref:NUDIX hydrolase n=1 Tax=Neisseria sp. Ec49-e6-T10 TaxID=3140744 RepID=UPI003EBF6B0E